MTRLAIALSLLAGCAGLPEATVAERLVGSWFQRISILGELKESVLTLRADGSFAELGRTLKKSAAVAHVPLQGTWRIDNDQLELEYASPSSSSAKAPAERKTILALSNSQFSYKDTKLGVYVTRTRVERESP